MNTLFKAINVNNFFMAHANIIIYSHPQYFCITKYSCYTLIVPQLSTRQHVILPACRHDDSYM